MKLLAVFAIAGVVGFDPAQALAQDNPTAGIRGPDYIRPFGPRYPDPALETFSRPAAQPLAPPRPRVGPGRRRRA